MVRQAGTGALALAILAAASHAAAQLPAEAPPAAAKAVPAAPAATVAGTPIDLAEVEELIRPQLMELRSREHQLRTQALDVLIGRTLIEKEAAARGMTAAALDQAEVSAKVSVSDAEVKTLYDNNKARFSNVPEATAIEQIRGGLTQQRENERRSAYVKELRARYSVTGDARALPRARGAGPGARCAATSRRAVTILEFSDFQCPYCQRVRPTMTRLREVYSDRVRFAFRHYPLDFHPQAQKAGEAAACAGEQGKFWEMHDRLWANPGKLQVDDLKAHAQALGLDAKGFDACLDSGRFASLLEKDLKAGQEYGVSGTPAFFVNGRPLVGAQPFEAFQQVIDDELARAAKTRTASQ